MWRGGVDAVKSVTIGDGGVEKSRRQPKEIPGVPDNRGKFTKLEFIMNKISNVSAVSSTAAREGQGSLKRSTDVGEYRSVESGPSSKVALTGMALAMAQAQRIAEETPAIDEQRVEEIRTAIANGSYSIDADRTAAALLAAEKDFVVK